MLLFSKRLSFKKNMLGNGCGSRDLRSLELFLIMIQATVNPETERFLELLDDTGDGKTEFVK